MKKVVLICAFVRLVRHPPRRWTPGSASVREALASMLTAIVTATAAGASGMLSRLEAPAAAELSLRSPRIRMANGSSAEPVIAIRRRDLTMDVFNTKRMGKPRLSGRDRRGWI